MPVSVNYITYISPSRENEIAKHNRQDFKCFKGGKNNRKKKRK